VKITRSPRAQGSPPTRRCAADRHVARMRSREGVQPAAPESTNRPTPRDLHRLTFQDNNPISAAPYGLGAPRREVPRLQRPPKWVLLPLLCPEFRVPDPARPLPKEQASPFEALR